MPGAAAASGADDGARGALRISAPWVRAMPPGRRVTAAYATLTNTGDTPLVVTGVSTSRGEATLHESVQEDGQMRMRARAEILVPAGGVVRLEPGGLHVMVMQLEETPAEGDILRLCFTGATLQQVCSDAPVARRAPADGHDGFNHSSSHSTEHR
jgi:copper(I)-binding protein